MTLVAKIRVLVVPSPVLFSVAGAQGLSHADSPEASVVRGRSRHSCKTGPVLGGLLSPPGALFPLEKPEAQGRPLHTATLSWGSRLSQRPMQSVLVSAGQGCLASPHVPHVRGESQCCLVLDVDSSSEGA